jgi:large subunit ribosomal protein L18|tara:strand:+ start:78 stop:446 length:369 start_codon:yes stop_codon:yes gene_type:complete
VDKNKKLSTQRQRRVHHVRNNLRGNSNRPRMCVTRSNKNIYCQIIDDAAGKTLVAVSTQSADIRKASGYGGNVAAATLVGQAIGEQAIAQGITAVKFDRGSHKYHGRLAAVATAAREAGLQF